MKIYTFFTDSHKQLLDLFLHNFPYQDNIELNIKRFPQECKSGSYMSDGWTSTMRRKVEYIIQSLEETPEGDWFVHADCDIILFDGWADILDKYKDEFDVLVQNDHPNMCAGFFFCKSNSKTKSLWNKVLSNLHNFDHDQSAMNFYLKAMKEVKTGILPNSYFTYGYFGKDKWNGHEFSVPNIDNLKMFHANWTQGIENKIALINKIIKLKNV